MKRLEPAFLREQRKNVHYSIDRKPIKLEIQSRKLRVGSRYEEFLEFFPDGTRVPCALMKIGFIAGNMETTPGTIQILRNQEKIENTPTANLSPKMLSEFRRYMSRLHKSNNLTKSDKHCIGSIITASDLGAYPKNAGEFSLAASDKGSYQGIRVVSDADKYDLDGGQTISQEKTNKNKSGSRSPEEEIREHREAVQNDVELDKI